MSGVAAAGGAGRLLLAAIDIASLQFVELNDAFSGISLFQFVYC